MGVKSIMCNTDYTCYSMTERQISMMVGDNVANTVINTDYKGPQVVCYAIDQQGGKSNCGYAEDVMMTLCSDSHGTPHALCYAIEGNVVDRVSAKNGKGWCEDVSPTLNTQDKHAICYALEGNGARPSHMGKGFSDDGKMYTLNTIEQHSVCYSVDCRNNTLNEELNCTLQAKPQGGWSVNVTSPVLIVEHTEKSK